jgi:sporulation protein YlmC with PRC-barrel domain
MNRSLNGCLHRDEARTWIVSSTEGMHLNRFITTSLLASIVGGIVSAQEAPKPLAPVSVDTHLRGTPRCKASQLIGCPITNSKNENLGEIQDIVLDGSNHRIAYAVVAFGGFLGMGEKYFAMPWRVIEVDQRGTGDKPRATLGLDQATLKTAPGFDKSKWPDMANAGWDKQVDDYYRLHNESARPAGAAEPKGTGADGKSGVDRAPGSKTFVHRRLSKLIGMDVVDVQGKKLADVEDLVVDTKVASVDGMLLSFGGTLGIGESLALVPSEALTLENDKNVLIFPCSKARLEAMALPSGKLPALNSDEWLTHGREVCATARQDKLITDGDTVVVDASGVTPVPFTDSYDVNKVETVKGTITTIGSVRVGDLQEERVRLRVRTDEGREVIVYAAPVAYGDQQALGLRSGKVIEVTGSPAKYGSQTVLVAGSIKAEGKSVKLRDDQGHATWTKR